MEREYMVKEHPFLAPARRRSMVGPVLLIGAGLLLLGANIGILPAYTWNVLGRLWPVGVILFGLEMMIGRRSPAGAWLTGLASGGVIVGLALLLFVTSFIPPLANMLDGRSEPTDQTPFAAPLDGIREAHVSIDFPGNGSGYLGAATSDKLIEAITFDNQKPTLDVRHSGNSASVSVDSGDDDCVFCFGDESEGRWELALTPEAMLDLQLDTHSGDYELDLSELQLEKLALDGGSGDTTLRLPAGDYKAAIDHGSGHLEINLPEDVGIRLAVDQGSGYLEMSADLHRLGGDRDEDEDDGNGDGDGVWESENFEEAAQKITLNIDQGSGSLIIR